MPRGQNELNFYPIILWVYLGFGFPYSLFRVFHLLLGKDPTILACLGDHFTSKDLRDNYSMLPIFKDIVNLIASPLVIHLILIIL